MGFSGTYLYENGQWRDADPTVAPGGGDGPWLHADIHDSDITTLRYHPAGPGTGIAYLGITPRTYFENPDASAPTDVTREAAGLATWWATIHESPAPETPAHAETAPAETGRNETAHDRRLAKEEEIIGYLAQDVDPEDDDLDDGDETDVDQLDDAEIYVEIKTARLIAALGLPPAFTR